MGNQSRPLTISKELVRGKEGYLLRIGDAIWEIEPQVKLDAQSGVAVETRADFVLWPVKKGGSQKPVVIYTDGFLYHKDKVADDTLKREAIRRSGKFRIWSLSWKDVQSVFKAQGDYATPTLDPSKMPSGSRMYIPAVKAAQAESLRPDNIPPMELLAQYLENPQAEQLFSDHAKAYAFSLLSPSGIQNGIIFANWNQHVGTMAGMLGIDIPEFTLGKTIFGIWKPRTANAHMTVYGGVLSDDMQNNKFKADALVYAVLDDKEDTRTEKYEPEWNGFWHFFNVLQFLNYFAAVSAKGLAAQVYCGVPMQIPAAPITPPAGGATAWPPDTLAQIFDVNAKAFAAKCAEKAIPAPGYIGYELVGADEAVVGEAEMAWEDKKVAFLLEEQLDSKEAFAAAGWKTIAIDDEIQADLFQEGE
jgi:DEAD/DEAH box helicase domain-containing protein